MALFLHMEPFQVFTCWGGAVLFQGSIFQEDRLRFRSGGPLECATSECDIITRDMWSLGYNRIMTVPTSPTAYTEANHNTITLCTSTSTNLTGLTVQGTVQRIYVTASNSVAPLNSTRAAYWIPHMRMKLIISVHCTPTGCGGTSSLAHHVHCVLLTFNRRCRPMRRPG